MTPMTSSTWSGPDPAAGARAAGDRVRRGHVRIAPVVEVEQRALGALEQDVLAAGEGRLDEPGRVVEVIAQPLAPAEGLLDAAASTSKVGLPIARQQQVLVRQRALDPLAQDRGIEQVLHPEAETPGPVAVGRPDPAAGRADLRTTEPRLVADVERDVVRHDHVGAPADPDARHVDPARGEHVELADEGHRVDHDAVADDRGDVRVEHARRGQPELEHLVAADHACGRRCRRPGSARPSPPARPGSRSSCPCPRRPTAARRSRWPASGRAPNRESAPGRTRRRRTVSKGASAPQGA